ncbi:MAG TPA: YeeE/YedE family protein [Gammaproteobacteria bacterium]|nr:YeeE/YedE family protein [Gammaproteobacteria bacterium]
MHTNISPITLIKNNPGNALFTVGYGLSILAMFTLVGTKQGNLYIIGSAIGLVLYQASFGFTAGFSNIINNCKTRNLRAQMLMLSAASILMLPMFSQGEFMGTQLTGKLTPISTAMAAGAFIFGIGMQLGGGCASGTLVHLGSGSLRMGITLLGFVVGSLIGTFHVPWWNEFPSLGKFSMIDDWGLTSALIINLSIAGVLWIGFLVLEKKVHNKIEPLSESNSEKKQGFLTNHWPLIVGVLLLAILNLTTLLVKGKPWGVTSGFALWGAKIFSFFGGDLSSYEYWQSASWAKALSAPVLKHSTSVMNFGLVIGIWWAASVSGKMSVSYKASGLLIGRLILGGLLLGYGARLASGCNIGAYFSGIASGSLHGWVWFAVAMLGNILGFKLKNTVFAED